MIGPGTGVRVYLACGVTDMRKGIAGLTVNAGVKLRQSPEQECATWLNLALEDLLVAVAEGDDDLIDEGLDEPTPDEVSAPTLRRQAAGL